MPWNEAPQRSASQRATTHAKILRRSMTDAERRLCRNLRHRLPISGSHFRRQVALGPYVADFCCLSARLIVEVDGDQHGHDCNIAYDNTRTEILIDQGYQVLRFSNAAVMREIDSVLETISAAIVSAHAMSSTRQPGEATSTPVPSP